MHFAVHTPTTNELGNRIPTVMKYLRLPSLVLVSLYPPFFVFFLSFIFCIFFVFVCPGFCHCPSLGLTAIPWLQSLGFCGYRHETLQLTLSCVLIAIHYTDIQWVLACNLRTPGLKDLGSTFTHTQHTWPDQYTGV